MVALEPGGTFGAAANGVGPRGDTKVLGQDIPDGWTGLDIGPDTVARFSEAIATAGTVLWNGPVGAFEDERFVHGTAQLALAIAECPGFTIVGGGDSVSALDHLGLEDRINFVSTGGGASLELVEHGDLPGLVALRGPATPRPSTTGLTGHHRRAHPIRRGPSTAGRR